MTLLSSESDSRDRAATIFFITFFFNSQKYSSLLSTKQSKCTLRHNCEFYCVHYQKNECKRELKNIYQNTVISCMHFFNLPKFSYNLQQNIYNLKHRFLLLLYFIIIFLKKPSYSWFANSQEIK